VVSSSSSLWPELSPVNPNYFCWMNQRREFNRQLLKKWQKILRKIRDAEGLTILVSEQVLSFVLDVSDKIVVIEKGNIVHQQARSGADEEQIASYLSV
jgi:ABC-type branched-subunit amino acid transport system ATPase component